MRLLAVLFPVTFVAHVVEEGLVGERFYNWFARVAGHAMPSSFFWFSNTAYGLVTTAAVVVALRWRQRWILSALAALIIANGAGHVIGTAVTASYSPGLVTGALLWIPLGVLTLDQSVATSGARATLPAALLGVLGQATVIAIAAIAVAIGSGLD